MPLRGLGILVVPRIGNVLLLAHLLEAGVELLVGFEIGVIRVEIVIVAVVLLVVAVVVAEFLRSVDDRSVGGSAAVLAPVMIGVVISMMIPRSRDKVTTPEGTSSWRRSP